jgi:hypothetical protein
MDVVGRLLGHRDSMRIGARSVSLRAEASVGSRGECQGDEFDAVARSRTRRSSTDGRRRVAASPYSM